MEIYTMDKQLSSLKKIYKEKFQRCITIAGSVRSLFESTDKNILKIALTDVAEVLKDTPYVLIGGLALGFHTKPRGTDDVDVLVLSDEQIQHVHMKLNQSGKFKKSREHASIHKQTGVEIELLSPQFLKQSDELVKFAINKSQKVPFGDNMLSIASADALVALKLKRFSAQDKADIQQLIKNGVSDISHIISDNLLLQKFEDMKKEVQTEEDSGL